MVMDLIQKASFNGPLANSVFCPKERIDGMSKESMLTFVNSNFKPVRCTVSSTGVRFEDALKMAEMIDLNRVRQADPCTARSNPKSGYEYHDLGPGRDTWIALAIPCCGSCDLACLLKHAIIAEACGTGAVATGQHREDRAPHGPLGTMAGGDVYTEYRAFNVSYFDIGIFGILAKTRACTAKQVARNAAEFLSNVGDLNFQQIATGKKRLRLVRRVVGSTSEQHADFGQARQNKDGADIAKLTDWFEFPPFPETRDIIKSPEIQKAAAVFSHPFSNTAEVQKAAASKVVWSSSEIDFPQCLQAQVILEISGHHQA
ncbi:hypothetical protein evm_014495 [Chilo suppressalis]|nr:hypothetical protein evm_014495 [Chilo suppressalis]